MHGHASCWCSCRLKDRAAIDRGLLPLAPMPRALPCPHVSSRARLDAIWPYELNDVVGDPFGCHRPRGA